MRLCVEIAYDGSAFRGWQSQADGTGVQDALERALHQITGTPIRVHAAGRTDTGVHALAQCAHFDLPGTSRLQDPAAWPAALNGNLPQAVRVLRAAIVPDNFHARFSASAKIYHYLILNAPTAHPLMVSRAWHCPWHLDHNLLQTAWQAFLGTHDFRNFCAASELVGRSTTRTLHRLDVSRHGPWLLLSVQGEGFLHRMVRCMAGAAVRVAAHKLSLDTLRSALKGGPTPAPARPLAAPAHGLCLIRVVYPPEAAPAFPPPLFSASDVFPPFPLIPLFESQAPAAP